MYVLEHPAMPDGNRRLLQKGALPFPHPFPEHYSKLRDWLEARAAQVKSTPTQLGLLKPGFHEKSGCPLKFARERHLVVV